MKKLFKLTIVLFVILIFCSCAEEKIFTVEGKEITATPYGWANEDARKVDNVVYEISAGNVACSIIFCETIIIPIWLTGWQLYEPVRIDTSNSKL